MRLAQVGLGSGYELPGYEPQFIPGQVRVLFSLPEMPDNAATHDPLERLKNDAFEKTPLPQPPT